MSYNVDSANIVEFFFPGGLLLSTSPIGVLRALFALAEIIPFGPDLVKTSVGNTDMPTDRPVTLSDFAERIISRRGNPPVVLTIAASDPSGGAGIQADLKTFFALGAYGLSVITSVTSQNTRGVQGTHPVSLDNIREQLRSVTSDFQIAAIKVGLLGSREIGAMLEKALEPVTCPMVLDPVYRSSSGTLLCGTDKIMVLLGKLMPMSYLLTPNIPEAERLTNTKIDSVESMTRAAEILHGQSAKNVLVKGGHLPSDEMTDVLLFDNEIFTFSGPKIESRNLHGTGCTLSSAIAVFIAEGYSLPECVQLAKEYVAGAILAARDYSLGHGNGPLEHTWFWRDRDLQNQIHQHAVAS